MLYQLYVNFQTSLEAGPFGFLRVVTFPTFSAMLGTLLSFALVLSLGKPTILWLRRRKIGDQADFDDVDLNAASINKRETPTMGGLLIVAAIAGTTLLLADITNFYVQMALIVLLWLGAVGAADDWLKLNAARQQSGRQGLRTKEKLALQVILALVVSFFLWRHAGGTEAGSHAYIPFFKDVEIPLNVWTFVLISGFVIVAGSNGVNITDGLDGLASGCSAMVAVALMVLTLVISDPRLSSDLLFHHIAEVGPLAIVCGAVLGATLGFLWFNCNPASVFMGDTGSLALGGVLAFVAVAIRQELLLLLLGGIFIVELASVALQVGWFKFTRKRYGQGRRIFLMSPLHHHFQKRGWGEVQIVVRFWLISAILAAAALATIKLR